MRVVHIGHAPLMEGHPDFGAMNLHPGRWALNLAIAQRKHLAIDVDFVTQVPGATRDHVSQVEGVDVYYIAAPDRLRSATFFTLDAMRISERVRDLSPDVVHAHGTEDAYALAAQASGAPYVVTAQGCYFIINREFRPRWFSRSRAIQVAEWFALKRARHVIAKSKYVQRELARAFPHLELHEIPNTIDPDLLAIPVDRPRRAGHLAFVGTVIERKGVHYLREAIEILERAPGASGEVPLTLHVFGNRPEAAQQSFEARELAALRALLGDRLVLHGTLPSLAVAEGLSTIPLLVAPSIEEMFGNQFIEALTVGANAIVTDKTAMAENSQRIGGGIVVPQGDSQALAAGIRSALSKSSSLEEIRSVRSRVLDFIGPETVARKHLELYTRIRSEFRRH